MQVVVGYKIKIANTFYQSPYTMHSSTQCKVQPYQNYIVSFNLKNRAKNNTNLTHRRLNPRAKLKKLFPPKKATSKILQRTQHDSLPKHLPFPSIFFLSSSINRRFFEFSFVFFFYFSISNRLSLFSLLCDRKYQKLELPNSSSENS